MNWVLAQDVHVEALEHVTQLLIRLEQLLQIFDETVKEVSTQLVHTDVLEHWVQLDKTDAQVTHELPWMTHPVEQLVQTVALEQVKQEVRTEQDEHAAPPLVSP